MAVIPPTPSAFAAPRARWTFPMECRGGCGTVLTGPHSAGGNHAGKGMCGPCWTRARRAQKHPTRACVECGFPLGASKHDRCRRCRAVWATAHTRSYMCVFSAEAFDGVSPGERADAARAAAAWRLWGECSAEIVGQQTVNRRKDGGLTVRGKAVFPEAGPSRFVCDTANWRNS